MTAWVLCAAVSFSTSVHAQLCNEWDAPVKIGALTAAEIHEASGLVASEKFPDRFYWINDSGDKARIYLTDSTGKFLSKFQFHKKKLKDTEALAYGPCAADQCLIVGDIGDNDAKRKNVGIYFIKETENFAKDVTPILSFTLTYPDGPRDAEAMILLPSGDLMIVAKEKAGVYVLPKSEMAASGEKVLIKRGTLPLEKWLPQSERRGRLITDMGIDLKRQVVGLLTYVGAIEIPLAKFSDLAAVDSWLPGTDYALVNLRPLIQQETLTYSNGRFIWSSEIPIGTEAPMNSLTCKAAP